MLVEKNGRTYSVRTPEELDDALQKELASLTPEEREALDIVLQELRQKNNRVPQRKPGQQVQNPGLLDALSLSEYKHPPVDILTFVKDPYYLGNTCENLYPKYLDDLIELFEGGYNECIMGGAIGIGKSFFCSIGLCRILYEISCLKDPHKTFGLAKDTNITLACFSVNEELATKVVFENIKTKILASPYFLEHFPVQATKKELRFPHSIWVAPRATTDTSALGLNVISAFMDEGNFLPKRGKHADAGIVDHADVIYSSLKRRMKSRFERKGKLPGILFIASSKTTTEDFVSRRLREAKDDPSVFVRDYCLTGDTRVPLLDGTTVSLKELADRFEGSEEHFWVYSLDLKSGLIVPGKAHHPRLTARNETILKVTLDNGATVRATPWHPFLLRSGEYRRADELRAGDSLMPLYRRDSEKGYEEVSQPAWQGRWQSTHHAVAKSKYGSWPKRGSDGLPTLKAQQYAPSNHKVISVKAAGTADVYDLSVEQYENFALEAGVFVHNSLWGIKPENYSTNTFKVMVGNESSPSKILEPGEELKLTIPEGTLVLDIPEDFRHDFEANLEGSLKDLAGVSVVSVSPFIQRREKIQDAVEADRKLLGPNRHPFSAEEYDPSRGGRFLWERMVQQTQEAVGRTVSDMMRPVINPHAQRHIHMDIGIRHDALGMCMAHISGYKDVVRRGEQGEHLERAPVYTVDFVLRIVPPPGDEIILGDIRRLIYDLAEHGYSISSVSTDSYQSRDTIQQLNQKGFNAKLVSVDTSMDPYENMKLALYEDRVLVYDYPILMQELRQLQRDYIRKKVDHPYPRGSKDVADALAGCLFTLSQLQFAQPLPIIRHSAHNNDAWLPEQYAAFAGGDETATESIDLDKYESLPFFRGSGAYGRNH